MGVAISHPWGLFQGDPLKNIVVLVKELAGTEHPNFYPQDPIMDHFKEDLVFPALQDYTHPDPVFNPFRKRKTYNNGIICELDSEFLNHYFHDLEWILGLYAWSKYDTSHGDVCGSSGMAVIPARITAR